jgi:hypothetical protein
VSHEPLVVRVVSLSGVTAGVLGVFGGGSERHATTEPTKRASETANDANETD